MYVCFASASNSIGVPQCSNASSSVAIQGPPSDPAITSANSPTAGTVTVAWTSPATLGTPAATAYVIVCADSTVSGPTCNSVGSGVVTASVAVPATSASISDLIGGTIYTCFISVSNSNGKACSIASASVTVRTAPPSAPTVTSLTSPDSGELSLSASASAYPGNPAVTAYTLRCVPANATTQGCLSTSAGVAEMTLPAAPTLSYTFPGLYGDSLYTCFAVTQNINNTVCSAGVSLFTLPYPVAPAAPINVSNSLYQTNFNSATLTWTDGVPLGECFGGGCGGVETGARAPPQTRPSLSRLPLAHVHHQVRGARRQLQRGRGRHAQRLPSCFAQRDRQGGHDECAGVQVRRLLRPGAELPGLRVLAGCAQRADDQHTEL